MGLSAKNRLRNRIGRDAFWKCSISMALLGGFGSVKAAELSIEGSVDNTPSELRQLSEKASVLEAKIRELELRIAENQKTVLGTSGQDSIDYRLELQPQADDQQKRDIVVSHVRMSIDGRPFVYTQSAMIVSATRPLPLFMGRIPAGSHQIRLQFQAAPLTPEVFSASRAAWRTVDRVIQLELSAAAGKQQTHVIQVGDIALAEQSVLSKEEKSANSEDLLPLVLDKLKEVK